MTDFRCSNCNRLLAKVESGKVQIKCKCGTMNEYKGELQGAPLPEMVYLGKLKPKFRQSDVININI